MSKERGAIESASAITVAAKVLTERNRTEKGKIMIMENEEVTEWEDREAVQLASTQQIHFLGPQITQCYVSQDP